MWKIPQRSSANVIPDRGWAQWCYKEIGIVSKLLDLKKYCKLWFLILSACCLLAVASLLNSVMQHVKLHHLVGWYVWYVQSTGLHWKFERLCPVTFQNTVGWVFLPWIKGGNKVNPPNVDTLLSSSQRAGAFWRSFVVTNNNWLIMFGTLCPTHFLPMTIIEKLMKGEALRKTKVKCRLPFTSACLTKFVFKESSKVKIFYER